MVTKTGIEVEVQGEKIEAIHVEIQEVVENVENAEDELIKARDKGARNHKFLQAGLIAAGAFVLILIFVVIIRKK